MSRLALLPALFLIALLSLGDTACAQPLPPKKDQTLSTIEDQVKEQKEAQKNLEKEAAELQKDMTSLKSKLVDVASKVQDQESAMTDLEAKPAQPRHPASPPFSIPVNFAPKDAPHMRPAARLLFSAIISASPREAKFQSTAIPAGVLS